MHYQSTEKSQYYYIDTNGEFYFQEIKNFLNTGGSTQDNIEDALEDLAYLANAEGEKSIYNFEDNLRETNIMVSNKMNLNASISQRT